MDSTSLLDGLGAALRPVQAALPTLGVTGWMLVGGLMLLGLVAAGAGWRALGVRRRRAGAAKVEVAGVAVRGMVSRATFDQRLELATRSAPDGGFKPQSVLFVNLDNFRSVNETHGFAGGNEVLVQGAERLAALVATHPLAAQSMVLRLGVDEFVIHLPAGQEAACEMAGHVATSMARPFRAANTAITLGASIGIAVFPAHGAGSRLVTHAAQAMQAAKRAGGGDFMVFDPQMAVDQREQAELLADLRHAVKRGELELWYQPKIDARSLQITAAEALVRWRHPKRGLVSPGVFIPLAERSGLIGGIGAWVIEEATRQAAVWRNEGLRMRVAINLSAYQMRQHDLVDHIEAALHRHKLQPNRFTVEITESVAMEDTEVTQRSFNRMRQAGLHVSIDDFGVGQASLSYLRRLPAAELKIDASFVKDIATSDDARAIVDAVVRLAHALSLKVVAEGVETAEQRDRLIGLGCDELQGYLFARPMTARALATWAMMDGHQPEGGSADARAFRESLFQDTRPAEV